MAPSKGFIHSCNLLTSLEKAERMEIYFIDAYLIWWFRVTYKGIFLKGCALYQINEDYITHCLGSSQCLHLSQIRFHVDM